jgi:hypothetical protein
VVGKTNRGEPAALDLERKSPHEIARTKHIGEGTQERKSEIFLHKTEQDSHPKIQRSPPSLPHLIIGTQVLILAHSLLSKKCKMKIGEVAMSPNPIGSYL